MTTWDVYNTMGSKHKTYSSVCSWLQPKWPFMPPSHKLNEGTLPTASSASSPSSSHADKESTGGQQPWLPWTHSRSDWCCWGLPSSSAHQSTFESDTLTHFPFNLFLSSGITSHSHLFFLLLLLHKGLEGLVMVGLAPGSKREKDS